MSVHAFIDETRYGGYVIAAAVLPPRRLGAGRAAMRQLCLPGQPRLHLVKERPDRRGQIATAICALGVEVHIYDSSGRTSERDARQAILQQLVVDLAGMRGQRLVIEQDDSLVRSDQRTLYEAVRKAGVSDTLAYEHLPPRSEPLLWIADAAAWCWTHGPQWRARIQPVVRRVTRI